MSPCVKNAGIFISRLVGLPAALGATAVFAMTGCKSGENTTASTPATRPEKGEVMITIVFDNNPSRKDLKPGWGFSCVIRGLPGTILFDTGGDGRTLLDNARDLGVRTGEIDLVVLSHIHGDHTGGLWDLLRARGGVKVYSPVGFGDSFKRRVSKLGGEVIEADESINICDGAMTTGTMGKGYIEEHGLCVKTPHGWVLITGCAHPGIADMTEQATKLADSPMHLVIGGFHMSAASKRQIEKVIDKFEKLGVEKAAPCHCSGNTTRMLFKKHYDDNFIPACVGTSLHFKPQKQDKTETGARP